MRFVSLLHAEEKSLPNKRLEIGAITSVYNTAIEDMVDEKLVQTEALANERAGFILAGRGWQTEARPYFRRAMDLYLNEWGATAKYEWLKEESAKYLALPAEGALFPQQVVVEAPAQEEVQ